MRQPTKTDWSQLQVGSGTSFTLKKRRTILCSSPAKRWGRWRGSRKRERQKEILYSFVSPYTPSSLSSAFLLDRIEIIDRSMQSGNHFGGPKRFYTEPMFCYYREESLSLSHLYSFEGGRCPFSQPPTFHKVLESKKLWGHMAHNQLKIRGAESPLGGIEEERSRRKNQAL